MRLKAISRLLRILLLAVNGAVFLWCILGLFVLIAREGELRFQYTPEAWRQHVGQSANLENLQQLAIHQDTTIRNLWEMIGRRRTDQIILSALLCFYASAGFYLVLQSRSDRQHLSNRESQQVPASQPPAAPL